MKAITLKHPWAFAICHMGKRIENRSWTPPQSLIGQTIAIHGGINPKAPLALREIQSIGSELINRFGPPEGFTHVKLQDLIMPGIVATATLSGVLSNSRDPWFDHSGYGWQLSNVVVLEKAIPCTGAQGFWDVPADVLQQINSVAGHHKVLMDGYANLKH